MAEPACSAFSALTPSRKHALRPDLSGIAVPGPDEGNDECLGLRGIAVPGPDDSPDALPENGSGMAEPGATSGSSPAGDAGSAPQCSGVVHNADSGTCTFFHTVVCEHATGSSFFALCSARNCMFLASHLALHE
jgi:hypothetical protein